MTRRRWLGGVALFSSSALLGCALSTQDPRLAALFTALSAFAAHSTQPLWWSCAIGISGRHIGALFGLMNSVGVFGAMSSQYLVGAMADWLGSKGYSGRMQWDPMFYVDMGVLMVAGILSASFRLVTVEPPDLSPADSRPGPPRRRDC